MGHTTHVQAHAKTERQRDSKLPEAVFFLLACLFVWASPLHLRTYMGHPNPSQLQLHLENTKSNKFHILIQGIQCVNLSQILPVTER